MAKTVTTTAGAVVVETALAAVCTKTGMGVVAVAGFLTAAYLVATASLALAVVAMVVSTAAAIGGIVLLARAAAPAQVQPQSAPVRPQVAPVRQPVRVLEARPVRELTATPHSIAYQLLDRVPVGEPRTGLAAFTRKVEVGCPVCDAYGCHHCGGRGYVYE
jgi:hypothetical protein